MLLLPVCSLKMKDIFVQMLNENRMWLFSGKSGKKKHFFSSFNCQKLFVCIFQMRIFYAPFKLFMNIFDPLRENGLMLLI